MSFTDIMRFRNLTVCSSDERKSNPVINSTRVYRKSVAAAATATAIAYIILLLYTRVTVQKRDSFECSGQTGDGDFRHEICCRVTRSVRRFVRYVVIGTGGLNV